MILWHQCDGWCLIAYSAVDCHYLLSNSCNKNVARADHNSNLVKPSFEADECLRIKINFFDWSHSSYMIELLRSEGDYDGWLF